MSNFFAKTFRFSRRISFRLIFALSLFVCLCSGAWADTVIYAYKGSVLGWYKYSADFSAGDSVDSTNIGDSVDITDLAAGNLTGFTTPVKIVVNAMLNLTTGDTAVTQPLVIENGVTLINNSSAVLTTNLDIKSGGSVYAVGGIRADTVTNSGYFETSSYNELKAVTNDSGATIKITGSGSVYTNGTLENSGSIEVDTKSTLSAGTYTSTASATLTNNGTFTPSSLNNAGKITNNGTFSNYNGDASQVVNTGTIENTSSGTIKLTGGFTNDAGGIIENTGSVTGTANIINNGTINNSDSGSIAAQTINNNGAINNSGSGTIAASTMNGTAVNDTSVPATAKIWTGEGAAGDMTDAANWKNSSLPAAGDTIYISVNSYDNYPKLTADSDFGAGKLTIDAGASLDLNGYSFSVDKITNSGSLYLCSADAEGTGKTLTAGEVDNYGTFYVSSANSGGNNTPDNIVTVATFNNSGIVQLKGTETFNITTLTNSSDSTVEYGAGYSVRYDITSVFGTSYGNLKNNFYSTLKPGASDITINGEFTNYGIVEITDSGNLDKSCISTGRFVYSGNDLTVKDFGDTDYCDLVVSGSNAKIESDLVCNGTFLEFDEPVSVGGNLTLTGKDGGTGKNSITFNNTVTFTKAVKLDTDDINFRNSVTFTGGNALTGNDDTVINFAKKTSTDADISLELSGTEQISIGPKITIGDGVTVKPVSSVTFSKDVTNEGSLTFDGAAAGTFSGAVLNSGTLSFGSGEAVFNGAYSGAGSYSASSTANRFMDDADFSAASGFTNTSAGAFYFYNITKSADEAEATVKTKTDMDFASSVYAGGKLNLVINGTVQASAFRLEDYTGSTGTYFNTVDFTTRLTGDGTLKVTGTGTALNITRVSGETGVTGIFDAGVNIESDGEIQTHSGTTLKIAAGKEISTVKFTHSSDSGSPASEIQINGKLTVTDTLNYCNNVGSTKITVADTGTLTAKKITANDGKTYTNDGSDSLIVNNGNVVISDGGVMNLKSSFKIQNNKTITAGTGAEIIFNGTVSSDPSVASSSVYSDTTGACIALNGAALTVNSVAASISKITAAGTCTLNGSEKLTVTELENTSSNLTIKGTVQLPSTSGIGTLTIGDGVNSAALSFDSGATVETGSVVINSGALVDAGDSIITVSGDWTNNNADSSTGGLTAGTGTVSFVTASGGNSTITGNTSFYNLSAENLGGRTLTVNGNTLVSGKLNLSGSSSSSKLTIGTGSGAFGIAASQSGGKYLTVSASGPVVQNSSFVSDSSINYYGACSEVSPSGGTAPSGWVLYATEVFVWKGEASGDGSSFTAWETDGSWLGNVSPVTDSLSSEIVIPSGCKTWPELDTVLTVGSLSMDTGTKLSVKSGKTLTISDSAAIAGTVSGNLTDANGFTAASELTLASVVLTGKLTASAALSMTSSTINGNLTASGDVNLLGISSANVIDGSLACDNGLSITGSFEHKNTAGTATVSDSSVLKFSGNAQQVFKPVSTLSYKVSVDKAESDGTAGKITFDGAVKFGAFDETTDTACDYIFDGDTEFAVLPNSSKTGNDGIITKGTVYIGENCTTLQRDDGALLIRSSLENDSTGLNLPRHLNLSGNFTDKGSVVEGKITLNGSSEQIFIPSGSEYPSMDFYGNSGSSVKLGGTLKVKTLGILNNSSIGNKTSGSDVNIEAETVSINTTELSHTITLSDSLKITGNVTLDSVNQTEIAAEISGVDQTLAIDGTLTNAVDKTTVLEVPVTVSGAVTNGGVLTIDKAFVSDSSFANNKIINLSADLTVGGDFTNDAAGAIELSSSVPAGESKIVYSGGNFTDSGTIGSGVKLNFNGKQGQTFVPNPAASYTSITVNKTEDSSSSTPAADRLLVIDGELKTATLAITDGSVQFKDDVTLTNDADFATKDDIIMSGGSSDYPLTLSAPSIKTAGSIVPLDGTGTGDRASYIKLVSTGGNIEIGDKNSTTGDRANIGSSSNYYNTVILDAGSKDIVITGSVYTSNIDVTCNNVSFEDLIYVGGVAIHAQNQVSISGLQAESLTIDSTAKKILMGGLIKLTDSDLIIDYPLYIINRKITLGDGTVSPYNAIFDIAGDIIIRDRDASTIGSINSNPVSGTDTLEKKSISLKSGSGKSIKIQNGSSSGSGLGALNALNALEIDSPLYFDESTSINADKVVFAGGVALTPNTVDGGAASVLTVNGNIEPAENAVTTYNREVVINGSYISTTGDRANFVSGLKITEDFNDQMGDSFTGTITFSGSEKSVFTQSSSVSEGYEIDLQKTGDSVLEFAALTKIKTLSTNGAAYDSSVIFDDGADYLGAASGTAALTISCPVTLTGTITDSSNKGIIFKGNVITVNSSGATPVSAAVKAKTGGVIFNTLELCGDGLEISGNASVAAGKTLTLKTSLSTSDTSNTFTVSDKSNTFTVSSGAVLLASGTDAVPAVIGGAGAFLNNGTIQLGTDLTVNCNFTDSGTIVSGGKLNFNGKQGQTFVPNRAASYTSITVNKTEDLASSTPAAASLLIIDGELNAATLAITDGSVQFKNNVTLINAADFATTDDIIMSGGSSDYPLTLSAPSIKTAGSIVPLDETGTGDRASYIKLVSTGGNIEIGDKNSTTGDRANIGSSSNYYNTVILDAGSNDIVITGSVYTSNIDVTCKNVSFEDLIYVGGVAIHASNEVSINGLETEKLEIDSTANKILMGGTITLTNDLVIDYPLYIINRQITLVDGTVSPYNAIFDVAGNIIIKNSAEKIGSINSNPVSGTDTLEKKSISLKSGKKKSIQIQNGESTVSDGTTVVAGLGTINSLGSVQILGDVFLSKNMTIKADNLIFAGTTADDGTTLNGESEKSLTVAVTSSAAPYGGNIEIPESCSVTWNIPVTVGGSITNDGTLNAKESVIAGDLITNGTVYAPSSVTVAGDFTDNGTWCAFAADSSDITGTITFNGQGIQNFQPTSGTNYNKIIVNDGITGDSAKKLALTVKKALAADVTEILNAKTITITSAKSVVFNPDVQLQEDGIITCSGAVTFNGKYSPVTKKNTFNAGTGTVTFAKDVDFSNTIFDNGASVDGTGGTIILSPAGSEVLTVTGAKKTGAAAADGQVYNEVQIKGNVTFTSSNVFNIFKAQKLGGKTITFAEETTQTINESLIFTGTSASSLLTLRSSSEGNSWNIRLKKITSKGTASTYAVEYVDLKDSYNNDNESASPAVDSDCYEELFLVNGKDSGNNRHWNLPGQKYNWKGGESGKENDWNTAANWVPSSIPGLGAIVNIEKTVSTGTEEKAVTDYPVLTQALNLNGTYKTADKTIDYKGTINIGPDAYMDFADQNVTAGTISNIGKAYLKGTAGQRIEGTKINSKGSDTGTVIYYGSDIAEGVWDGDYGNLMFAEPSSLISEYQTAAGTISSSLTVSGKTIIYSDTSDISLTGENEFTGNVTIGDRAKSIKPGNIIINAKSDSPFTLSADAYCDSLTVMNGVILGGDVTTTAAQTYNGAVTLNNSINLTGTTVSFSKNVNSDSSCYMKVNGDIFTLSPIYFAPDLILNGSFDGDGQAVLQNNFYITGDSSSLPPFSAVSIGSVTVTKDMIIDADRDLQTSGTITCDNFVLYKGNVLAGSSSVIKARKDLILLGPSYSIEDTATGITDEYKYQQSRLSPYNYAREDFAVSAFLPDGTVLSSEGDFTGTYTGSSKSVLQAGKNFYANGLTLSSASSSDLWYVDLCQTSDASIAFAEAYNCTVTNATVRNTDSSVSGEPEINLDKTQIPSYNCTVTASIGWDNDDFVITGAWTVRDNSVYVEFSSPLRNLHNEANDNIQKITYSEGPYSAFYSDPDCQTALSGETENGVSGNLTSVYIKADSSWNTDATGSTTGDRASTNRYGEHREVLPYLDIPRAVTGQNYIFTDKWGKRLNHYSVSNGGTTFGSQADAINQVQDKTGPVLYSVKTGQEMHQRTTGNAEEQHSYDAHNFIEFRYSEKVLFAGTADDSTLNLDAETQTVENVPVTDAFGAISGSSWNEKGKLSFAGLAVIENGKIYTGKAGSPDKYVNAFYRPDNFSIRLSVAGLTAGTVSDPDGRTYRNWTGYIESAELPSGTVDFAVNAEGKNLFITDSLGNCLEKYSVDNFIPSVDSSKNGIYGLWDVTEPVFAPLRMTSSTAWADTNTNYEAIGNTNGTGSTLDRIEFHLFDNTPLYDGTDPAEWFSEIGWCRPGSDGTKSDLYDSSYSYSADITGGSRQFAADSSVRTSGGVRYSSIANCSKGFLYSTSVRSDPSKQFDSSKNSYTGSTAFIFIGATSPRQSADTLEGNYFGVPLQDMTLPVNTTFKVSYDDTKAYVTDLAGNRLRSGTITTIDRTPPSYDLTLSALNQDKMMISFVKKLTKTVKYTDNDGNNIPVDYTFEQLLPMCFEVITIDDSGTASVSTDLQIDETVPAAAVESHTNDSFTSYMLTFNRAVKTSDYGKYYLRLKIVKGFESYFGHTLDPSTGRVNAAVTFIQDEIGNYMQYHQAHPISDFAINVINPLYAYDSNMVNEEGDPVAAEVYQEGSYAVHDWNADQQNFGTLPAASPLTIVAQTYDGTEDNAAAPENIRVYLSASPSKGSVSEQYNFDFDQSLRIWLPNQTDAVFAALSESNNKNFQSQDSSVPDSESPQAGQIIFDLNQTIADNWKAGDQVSFLFGLLDSDNKNITVIHSPELDVSNTEKYVASSTKSPLFALRLTNESDITSLDLWSFRLKTAAKQRGGVTILNNVINPLNGEKTVLEVNNPSEGKYSVMVMTLDGSIVDYLARGTASEGTHYYTWDGRNKNGKAVARGIYFIRIIGNGFDETRKVMVVK